MSGQQSVFFSGVPHPHLLGRLLSGILGQRAALLRAAPAILCFYFAGSQGNYPALRLPSRFPTSSQPSILGR